MEVVIGILLIIGYLIVAGITLRIFQKWDADIMGIYAAIIWPITIIFCICIGIIWLSYKATGAFTGRS